MDVRRRIAALGAAVLLCCVTSLGALAEGRPEPGAILRDWYYLMNELVRHTATYSPPVASRSFAYLGITAFESAAGGSGKLVSLAGQLHGLDAVPQREAGAIYDETVINGLTNAPQALFDLVRGRYTGKTVVRLGS